MRVSYLQIYNEDVCDLLGKNPTTKLEVVILQCFMYICMHAYTLVLCVCSVVSVVKCKLTRLDVLCCCAGEGEARCWCLCERTVLIHCEEPQ